MGNAATGSLVRLTSGLEQNTKLNRPSTRRCLSVEYACCHPFSFVVVMPRIMLAHVMYYVEDSRIVEGINIAPPAILLSFAVKLIN